MKHFGIPLLVMVTVFLCTGWNETSRLIRVNKNGSGVIYVRVLKNPDYLDEGEKVYDEEALKAVNYGKGTRYAISQELKKDKRGWVGYLAKYEFSDISQIRIFPSSLPRAMTAAANDPLRDSGWRFRLTEVKKIVPEEKESKGKELLKKLIKTKDGDQPEKKEMVLEIIPLALEAPAANEDDGFGDDDDDAGLGAEQAENRQLKMQQRGRRYVTYIQVEGEIDAEKSNAPYVSKKKPNTIVLNDEQFAVIWNNGPAARKEIAEEEPFFGALGEDKDVDGWRTIASKVKVYFR